MTGTEFLAGWVLACTIGYNLDEEEDEDDELKGGGVEEGAVPGLFDPVLPPALPPVELIDRDA